MRYMTVPHRFFRHLPVLPFLYLAVIPVVILDLFLELYHRVAWPIYGLKYERRGVFIVIDRHRLKYLSLRERLYCAYCGYVNGVLQYWVKIIGETERYWCAIRHQASDGYVEPQHHVEYIPYGDEEAFHREFASQKTRRL